MDKQTYEFICDKYADTEFALSELYNALNGYDNLDAGKVSNMHNLLKNMYVAFSEYYEAVIKIHEHNKFLKKGIIIQQEDE
jgi:hypothetical protein|nr:MAG TPA_asm: hypothetical protein [Caudoviricetes sp.]